MIIAEQKAFITTPDRSMESFVNEAFPDDITTTRTRVAMLPANAAAATPGNLEIPRIIPIMAPIAEPPEIPRIYGSARGFLKRAWNTSPPVDKTAPDINAMSTLGKRMRQIMVLKTGSGFFAEKTMSHNVFNPLKLDPTASPANIDTARISPSIKET